MSTYEWFVLFTVSGLALFVLEVFLPGWVAGTAASICMIAAAVTAFPAFGFKGGMLACILLMSGALAFVAFWSRLLPQTQVGKTLILPTPAKADPGLSEYAKLAGQSGKALTRLAPGGIVEIQGRRVDVVSEGSWIEPGDPITVVRVAGRLVTVRKAAV